MAIRSPLVMGGDGIPQQLQSGDSINPSLITGLRVESYTSSAGDASGNATVTFSPAFTTIPTVLPLANVSGTTVSVGKVVSVTKTGCTLLLATSRGTLVLSSGPFQAGTGATIPVVVIGA